VELGQVFSEYFGFPCQFTFHRLLHIRHHLSSRAGKIGQLVVDVPSGLNTSLHRKGEDYLSRIVRTISVSSWLISLK
jgi:hypothetical protein